MKNRISYGLLICLAMFFAFSGVGLAETSSSVTVSFTIPVMPGLNAPLIEENKTVDQQIAAKQENAQAQQEIQTSSPPLIQTEKQEEKTVAKGESSQVMVKTIYSR
jgi:hypothetical protein